jgi:hypothetical protein
MAGRDASSPRLRHPPRLIKSERRTRRVMIDVDLDRSRRNFVKG